MKTTILNKVLSEKELFFMYRQITTTPAWVISGESTDQSGFLKAPLLPVRTDKDNTPNYPLYLWGQSVVFRIAKLLEKENIGIPTELNRMWFNVTFNGKKTQHWLHQDDTSNNNNNSKSILLFMTPIWQPDWRGSFYVDGEEFKFKPGSAVIFDAREYHQGESPISEIYNWQRITCNMLIE